MFDYLARIEELCQSRNWSYYELAKQAGLSQNTVYNWTSTRAVPTLVMLERVAEAFGITIEQFFNVYSEDTLSKEEREVIEKWTMMSDLEKDTVWDLIDTFEQLKSNRETGNDHRPN